MPAGIVLYYSPDIVKTFVHSPELEIEVPYIVPRKTAVSSGPDTSSIYAYLDSLVKIVEKANGRDCGKKNIKRGLAKDQLCRKKSIESFRCPGRINPADIMPIHANEHMR
ncbi:hypothetical protein ACQ86N_44560 [Puia sp. P3]|uniref:hypothetical protein n=1 Tax=Puia sp. P3 TaxID=3423952 RepID=UPI003D663DDD